jgi:ABC-2 type transport system permease protein
MFFYMGFGNLGNDKNIDTIPVAVVTEDSNFADIMADVELKEGKKLFAVQVKSLEEAKELLNNNQIEGYIIDTDTPELYIKESGINQSIMKAFTDNYLHMSQTANSISALKQKAADGNFLKEFSYYKNYLVDGSDKERNPEVTLIYFYTLIALACMFGTNWGFREMIDIQANQSMVGARINVSPIHKIKLLFINFMAAFTLHYISILFLLFFLNKVLGIDFGNKIGFILLTALLGSLCGISLGAMICVVVKANVKVRSAILNAVVIGGGVLSGMVAVNVKYLIAAKAPILSYINPASLITDAFYCLYYYEGYERLFQNLYVLGILTLLFGVVTYYEVRRREYASI